MRGGEGERGIDDGSRIHVGDIENTYIIMAWENRNDLGGGHMARVKGEEGRGRRPKTK